jgi:hypothetical protein
MELIEDVKQGLNMIKYLNTHPEEFEDSTTPFFIGLMQLLGGFLAEVTNLFMLATRSSVENSITFFVAFHVLCAIDNIYAEGISDFKLMEAVEEPLVFKRNPKEIKFKTRDCKQKMIRIIYKSMLLYYNSFYYYFMPFLVNFVPYFFPGNPNKMSGGGH